MEKPTLAVIGGTGAEGSGLAVRWAAAGYPVVIGSRSAEKATTVAAELRAPLPASSAPITGATNADAAAAAEIVVLSVPYSAQANTINEIKDACQGKIVITVGVPLQPPKVSTVWRPPGGSAAEEAQAQLGEAVRVVAAFQNVSAGHLRDLNWEADCDVLATGDDKAAKQTTIELANAAGFFALDAGPLANASVVEGLTAVFIGINIRHKVKGSGLRVTGIPPRELIGLDTDSCMPHTTEPRANESARHLETIAVHAGRNTDPGTGAVMPPIHLSTTFERQPDGGYTDGFVYTRTQNPNRRALESCLAELEGGAAAAAFSSGQAATLSVLQALGAGEHVILPDDAYFGTTRLALDILARFGLAASVVDLTDLDQVRAAVRANTRLIWVESPSNPLLKITDIAAIAEIAHAAGAMCAVDNTWPSPLGQQPLQLGADLAMHSTTKYLGGHSDILGGAIVARAEDDFFARIRTNQTIGGAVPAPFDCWLLLRSIRTLPYRMRAHCAGAQRVAEYLADHPKVEQVHYPGLPTHPGHAIAARQMLAYGGMLSIQVQGGMAAAMAVAARVRLFTRATSLGGVESLIEHRASVEGPTSKTPQNLLRVSVGLEHPDDLIADLAQALG